MESLELLEGYKRGEGHRRRSNTWDGTQAWPDPYIVDPSRHQYHRGNLPGLGIFGLSYNSPRRSYNPAGLSCAAFAPSLANSSSSNAPGSCGSNILDPGVRKGDSAVEPVVGKTSFFGVIGGKWVDIASLSRSRW